MKPAIQRVFNYIEYEALKMSDTERLHLWALLTALRGPDSVNPALKREVTEVVRANTVPQLARAVMAHCGMPGTKISQDYKMRVPLNGEGHFRAHAQLAAEALDAY